jgi:hypothetical protein
MRTRKADCVISIVTTNIRELISISSVCMTSPDEASRVVKQEGGARLIYLCLLLPPHHVFTTSAGLHDGIFNVC